ncbi:hypothetical protein CASFOL_008970 [Castilleja foliolosa]|uniref:KIB1-4 beta-propeller domain-containing protein n=1 Tax=Castilleja foliolosa TaxID=1961234 RepID=A0ABD3E1Y0_9LAMI
MALRPSILKITTAATSLRSIFRFSCRGARLISTVNKSDESRTSSVESRISFLPSSYPWLMLSPKSCNTCYEFYSFAENRVLTIPKLDLKYEIEPGFRDATRILCSSHGWLACFNNGELFLFNPLSGRRVNLPPIHNLSTPDPNPYIDREYWCKKIIMTCSDPESEECKVVMIFGTDKRLALCCPGRNSTEWTVFESEKANFYVDFVNCFKHELFFSLKYDGAWDLKNPLSPSLVWSRGAHGLDFGPGALGMHEEYSEARGYLVMSQKGKLFLVSIVGCNSLKYPSKTVGFEVFKVVRVRDRVKLVEMDDGHLDGLVMFVGDPSLGIAIYACG